MSTLLGATSKPTYGYGYQGYPYDNMYALQLTLPAGGPWSIKTLGAWLAGDSTHFASTTMYLQAWNNSTGAVLGASASFVPTQRAYPNFDSYERAVATPFTVAGGTTILVGFGWAFTSGKGVQYPFSNANQKTSTNNPSSGTGTFSGAYNDPGKLQAWLYYDLADSAPTAPTLTAPATGIRLITGSTTFGFTHNDPDSDPCVSYDIQVSTDSSFASVTHWNDVSDTSGISGGTTISRVYGGSALSRGSTYYWRARTADGIVGYGPWSGSRNFKYNSLPTVAGRVPASAALGIIHNVSSSLALWTGSEAQCYFQFTPSDADGDTLTYYRFRIYNDNAGVKGTLLYDTGQVYYPMGSGVANGFNHTQGLANGTQYWWSIDLYDGYEWMGESTATQFKVRWSQGLYEFDTGAGGSTSWGFSNGAVAQTVAILFRSATSSGGTGATGLTAFQSAITAVTPQRWMQALVRLSTPTAGSNATLADMTLSYTAAPSTPDGWNVT